MTDNQTETLYTLEWKSKEAAIDGKSGLHDFDTVNQKVATLKNEYPDLEHLIELSK